MAIIEDGIVNKEEWEASSLRVLFLLKEAYGKVGKNHSLIKFYTEETDWWGHTGKGCKCYMDALGIGNGSVALVDIIKESKEGINEHRRTSDEELVVAFEANDIWEQIKEINPNIIICGGTYWVLKQYYPTVFPPIEKNTCHTILDGELKEVIVADSYHPSFGSKATKRSVASKIRERFKESKKQSIEKSSSEE